MKICVPRGGEHFSFHEVTREENESIETRLIRFGREALGVPLSVDYAWYRNGKANVIAKPINDSGYEAAALSKLYYEMRYLPTPDPDPRVESREIYSFDRPAVVLTSA